MSADLHHLAAAYALDALDADERMEFERHLATCDVCSEDVTSFGAVAANLADASIAAPPNHVKDAVMAKVTATRQVAPLVPQADDAPSLMPGGGAGDVVNLAERRQRKFSVMNMLAVAAAVALIAVGAIVIAGQRGGPGVDDVIAAPDALVTQLEGEAGSVRIVWSAERDQVAVLADGVGQPEIGFVYELWAIVGGTPTPAGLFEADDGVIRDVVDIDDVAAEAWGITIEPEGGSDAPTSEILYYAET